MSQATVFQIGKHKLRPLTVICQGFHDEVKNLRRPYIPISLLEYERLSDSGVDFFKIDNGIMAGTIVTYGNADNGYALMPVSKDRAEIIAKEQNA